MAACRWSLLILTLHLCFSVVLSCDIGFSSNGKSCVDVDECEEDEEEEVPGKCGENTRCVNTYGSFHCLCDEGFIVPGKSGIFSADSGDKCKDINECLEYPHICGPNAKCFNTAPHYSCVCDEGFISSTGVETFRSGDSVTCVDLDECKEENVCGENEKCTNTPGNYSCDCKPGFRPSGDVGRCQDICKIDKTICGNGTCHPGADGHDCACHAGFTNYGNKGSRCTELNCEVISDLKEEFPLARDLILRMTNSCLELTQSENPPKLDGDDVLQWLERLLSDIDKLLSDRHFKDNIKVSAFLDMVEILLQLIGPFIKPPGTSRSSAYTELELHVHKGADLPQGAVNLSTSKAQLNIQMETAAGHPAFYPGFTTVFLLSYANMHEYADGFFSGMKPQEGEIFKINSRVVTVAVSNRNTSRLKQPVTLTFHHLNLSNEFNHTCVFWDSSEDGGTWSPHGCSAVESNPAYTVCSCNHLSSFAVLMAQYDIEGQFELQLITWVGLSLSLVCLFFCILTFSLIRSIQSPRTTMHLHLCITLSIGIIIFLLGISRTDNRVGCAVVAGLLHFFYLAAFCWMCLEGIQLFRMVVLVFNTNFKTLYMLAGGYGVPAVIVGICALANAKGYGTDRYCWLNVESIWWFVGPACVIITINIFFFLITVWKLAQKFSSLNPDLDSLQKIKAFTITAVAQLCVLGTMWIFGCFQFNRNTIAMSYLFTIFGSLQGVLLFVMHCLFSKQVREEYGNILSRCCAPRKKSYTEFNSLNSSKAHASKSTQDTGESHI